MMFATAPYLWRGNWGGGDRQKYEQLKNNVMETLINRADTALGGIRNAIELKDAATPLTFERYTRNTDGATSAWSWDPRKKFYPSITSVNIETPVKNLFIGSCWATQIGGVPGAISAARQCLKKIE
jgi:phytoene dehydrogenase-like protein